MHVGINEVVIRKFHFEKTNLESEPNKNKQNGQLYLGFPNKVDNKSDTMIIQAKIDIDIKEKDFELNTEITGIFEVPNADYSDRDSEETKELVNSVLQPLLDKSKWYYALFFNEVNGFVLMPEIDFNY